MQSQNLKFKILNFESWFFAFSFQLLVVFGLCGCSVVEYFRSEKPPYDEELSASYYQTKLKESSSADVLATIHRPEYELLSQSKSVVASLGQKKKGHKIWFNMVAFDENKPAARRKYFFVVDEKAKGFLFWPRQSLTFDSEMVLETEVLDKPYANENARRIAMLRQVLKNARKDTDELAQDNKMLGICGMLINQTLNTVLQKLDKSPVLASKLSDADGLGFDHITLGKGSIGMGITDDIVKVKVKVGSLTWTSEAPFALEE
jgi:hypothetical protein